MGMPTIKSLPEFSDWLAGLKDKSHRGVIVARVKRLGAGLLGDVRPVGEGVSEMRIHVGPGFRVYFVQRGQELVILLCGGDKSSQERDIERAKALARRLD